MKLAIICGPTASGKTDYAFNLALKNSGIIINADSRQLFKSIPIISASPSDAMKQEVAHYLYNFLENEGTYNVAQYVQNVKEILYNSNHENIYIVGGTGMYIDALINGIAEVPLIDERVREGARAYHTEVGNDVIYRELVALDPDVAVKLNKNDTQRVLRAYEVIKSTGKSLKYWQSISKSKGILSNINYEIIVKIPDRKMLYDNCNKRFLSMLELGGMDEVKNLGSKAISAQILNAIGVEQIMDYIQGKSDFAAMVNEAQTKTRQYAKRQVTWFKRYC